MIGTGGFAHAAAVDVFVVVATVVISHLDPPVEIRDGLNSIRTGPN